MPETEIFQSSFKTAQGLSQRYQGLPSNLSVMVTNLTPYRVLTAYKSPLGVLICILFITTSAFQYRC